MEELRSLLVDLLVAHSSPRHRQRSIHVHVMTSQIQTDEPLEQQRPSRPRTAQKNEQTRSCAPIRHHIEHCAKLGRLLKIARSDAVKGVQKAGYAVEEGASTWMEWHVVEGGDGEEDARVTDYVRIE